MVVKRIEIVRLTVEDDIKIMFIKDLSFVFLTRDANSLHFENNRERAVREREGLRENTSQT
jgi:hypothetical protein